MINTKAQEEKIDTLLSKAQVPILDLAHCGEYSFFINHLFA